MALERFPKTSVVVVFAGIVRSPEMNLRKNPIFAAGNELLLKSTEVKGIKLRSVFNDLPDFHVCQPGLPPCLGHDIFEGVLSYNLDLYLNYFIKKMKWFTCTL